VLLQRLPELFLQQSLLSLLLSVLSPLLSEQMLLM
jgi:hypothetical protein